MSGNIQPRDQPTGATCELELCLCRADCGDGLIETLRVAFELEVHYRDGLQELADSSSDAAEPPMMLTVGKRAPSG